MAFNHYPRDVVVAIGDLSPDTIQHAVLFAVIFIRVCVRAIHHGGWIEADRFKLASALFDFGGVVVRAIRAAA